VSIPIQKKIFKPAYIVIGIIIVLLVATAIWSVLMTHIEPITASNSGSQQGHLQKKTEEGNATAPGPASIDEARGIQKDAGSVDAAAYAAGDAYLKTIAMSSDDKNERFERIKKDAHDGNIEALFYFATNLLSVASEDNDMEMAADAMGILKSVANTGHIPSEFFLGNVYLHGWVVPEDTEEGIRWIRKAADQGSEQSQAQLRAMNLPRMLSRQDTSAEKEVSIEHEDQSSAIPSATNLPVEKQSFGTATSKPSPAVSSIDDFRRLITSHSWTWEGPSITDTEDIHFHADGSLKQRHLRGNSWHHTGGESYEIKDMHTVELHIGKNASLIAFNADYTMYQGFDSNNNWTIYGHWEGVPAPPGYPPR
jgi:hypothetical protein